MNAFCYYCRSASRGVVANRSQSEHRDEAALHNSLRPQCGKVSRSVASYRLELHRCCTCNQCFRDEQRVTVALHLDFMNLFSDQSSRPRTLIRNLKKKGTSTTFVFHASTMSIFSNHKTCYILHALFTELSGQFVHLFSLYIVTSDLSLPTGTGV